MIEFIEETHTYLVDGMILPSVSQILNFINPTKYDSIPEYILEKAKIYGTNVHKAIETYEKYDMYSCDENEELAMNEYKKLKFIHEFEVIVQEKFIRYHGRYCGRFDGILKMNGLTYLYDIKTTSKADEEALSWQLGMYKLGYETMTGEKIDKCCCIWIPKKKKGKFIVIEPKTESDILEVLDEYEKK